MTLVAVLTASFSISMFCNSMMCIMRHQSTAAFANHVKPTKINQICWGLELPRLGLLVLPTGKKHYVVQYRPPDELSAGPDAQRRSQGSPRCSRIPAGTMNFGRHREG
jgi:hypothetical protein